MAKEVDLPVAKLASGAVHSAHLIGNSMRAQWQWAAHQFKAWLQQVRQGSNRAAGLQPLTQSPHCSSSMRTLPRPSTCTRALPGKHDGILLLMDGIELIGTHLSSQNCAQASQHKGTIIR